MRLYRPTITLKVCLSRIAAAAAVCCSPLRHLSRANGSETLRLSVRRYDRGEVSFAVLEKRV